MRHLRPTLILLGIALSTWRPFVRMGAPTPLGRLDAWAVHGMSHSRVDGIDPLQVPLTGALVVCACLAPFHAGAAHNLRRVALTMLAVVSLRILWQLPLGVQPDVGLVGLGLIAAAITPSRSSRADHPPRSAPATAGPR